MSEEPEGETMRYGMIGHDDRSESEKLEKYLGEVDWSYLEKHYAAGALVYVDPALDLVSVGKAFVEDDAETIAAWKKAGDILIPSTPHAAYWEESELSFEALVVSPFVLMREAPEK